jgi:DNA invertase Pin-like site-specific DNA recombinase
VRDDRDADQDEDGLYDPRSFNDRLLLGMKGQMSEAELHFIRARLCGGILSEARRGELITAARRPRMSRPGMRNDPPRHSVAIRSPRVLLVPL